ncbi:YitT family protein [Fictibacillus terranigra]|uniref:YitT family protein n=1 Tax=Fictibacillus terranigra TaxID=3058424 RepID=A0ABT8E4N3_9BACL|nr:YitT family protein [Fictibacillus sp. CENA-BCM004]MDN4072858.1 YitT family protein [Fictibacillus sp. CENA-BCM004]
MIRKIKITVLSSLLMGIGINGFIIPIHLINGGLWGVSLILNYLLGFKVAITFICLNAPIFIVARLYDKTYFFNGLLGVLISSVIIYLLTPIQFMVHMSTLCSVLLGGTAIGIGLGFMLREHISPGGIDLLALIISKLFSINVGMALLLLDAIIIFIGILTLRDERLIYSLTIVIIAGLTATIITSIKSIKVYV